MAVDKTEIQVRQIKSDIKNKTLALVYLIKGEEPYYIDIIGSEFENNLIDESSRDFNLNVCYGKDCNASVLISLCRQYPMMSDRRLVILKEAQLMDSKEWGKFLIYLSKPLTSTVLVICNKSKTFDIKCKNAIVKAGGVVIESEKIKDSGLLSWIVTYVRNKGFEIDDGSANMLCEYLGNNLQKISNEVDKMLLNIKDRKNITISDIQQFIGISKDYNVFELQHALAVKNLVKANEIINYFEKNPKDNPIQLIIPVLFAFFTKLLIASQVASRNPSEVAGVLGFRSPFAANEYVRALNYYNMNQLLNIVSLFNEYDLKSKGIGITPLKNDAMLLRELVFKILHTV